MQYVYDRQLYLGAVGVVNIRRVQHSRVFDKRIHFFVQDVEVTGIIELERPCKREGVDPGEDCIKEVAGNVETLITPSQLHQVTARAGEWKEDSSYHSKRTVDTLLSITLEFLTRHFTLIHFQMRSINWDSIVV